MLNLKRITFAKSKQTLRRLLLNLKRTVSLLWAIDKKLTLTSFGFQLLSQIESLTSVYLFKLMIDNVVALINKNIEPQQALRNFTLYVFLNFSISTIISVLGNYANLVEGLLTEKLINGINYRLHRIANRLQIKYFEDPAFYDRYEKVRRSSQGRVIRVFYSITETFGEFISAVSFLVILAFFQPLILVLILIGVLPLFVFNSFFAHKKYLITDSRVPESRLINYLSSMLFSEFNTKELRIFGLHRHFQKLYEETSEKFNRENARVWLRESHKRVPLQILSQGSSFIAFAYIAYKAIFGAISLGSFNFYNSAYTRSERSIRRIFRNLSALYEENLYLNDLFEFLNLSESFFEKSGGKITAGNNLEIKIENLSFQYPGSKEYVLKNINLEIRPGESLALVGKNGAGKTTLVKLLCGFYEPTDGRILVNGQDLKLLDLEEYRKKIGVVFQDFSYYNFSAGENIGFGRLEEINNHKKIEAAAQKAGAREFIEKLPKKYNQLIGKQFEGGINLSIGQLQRLALARAFMADAPLMILDEPTSASDAEAEAKLYGQIEKIAEEKSLLLISHRFSTVKIAEKICVIDKGKIIEVGSHAELLKKGGSYAKLYRIQAKGYKDK